MEHTITQCFIGMILIILIIGIFVVNELITINKTLKEIKNKGDKRDNG